jgi:hypothetical protein
MALTIIGRSCCAICESVIEAGDDVVATSAFIAASRHAL